jgi:tetratricopeptide (TPR) repeat protein
MSFRSRIARAAGVAAACLTASLALAAGSPQPADREAALPAEYERGLAHVQAGDFEAARKAFDAAQRKAPGNPDVLNMLAYSLRKSGQLDRAIATYHKALRQRPRFPQAREYLAEAYLQAALRELETLEGYGDEARSEREELVRSLESAAARAAWSRGDGSSETAPKPGW